MAPAHWVCAYFPLHGAGAEIVTTEFAVQGLLARLDRAPAHDTTAVSAVLHAAHQFRTRQGPDGMWSTAYNARTGEEVGGGRSLAPLKLFRRLDTMLGACEFERCFELAGITV